MSDYQTERSLQLARWNQSFTMISITHAAFLGAFLSKIDYRGDELGLALTFICSVALVGALYEIHGFGWLEVRNALAKKHEGRERFIFSAVALPIAPATLFFVGDPAKASQYPDLCAIIITSWFVCSLMVGSYLARQVREASADVVETNS